MTQKERIAIQPYFDIRAIAKRNDAAPQRLDQAVLASDLLSIAEFNTKVQKQNGVPQD